jgi:hypothetical protein
MTSTKINGYAQSEHELPLFVRLSFWDTRNSYTLRPRMALSGNRGMPCQQPDMGYTECVFVAMTRSPLWPV